MITWIVYFLAGPAMVLLATIFKAFPPAHINNFYGYRTKRSTKDQASWNEAQRYANDLMLWSFIINSLVELPLFLLFDLSIAVLASCVGLIVCVFAVMYFTERHLRMKFG
ncbi:SdpI family protein [Fulvivirga sp. M361]|uniref:SdpI family protein n=1 Tax=Fulvivirga sp. M361 TaxID=2594266 RepID=UPI00117A8192|nr:SdpI family protein [Fulvivirga sp. M361]TRX62633.1 SdpI family protein [Fulvivirga sp. M361]